MSIVSRKINDRAEWLDWRREHVTASVAAALLGEHERVSPLALYLDKSNIVPLDSTETPAMKRGKYLEPVAAQLIRDTHPEWQVEAASDYLFDPDHRLGCTPDLYVRAGERFGIIEVKSVEPSYFEKTWLGEDGTINPPMAAAIQATLTRHLCKADFAYIAALRVGRGIDLDLVDVPHVDGLVERIEAAADAFWRAVDRGEPPPPIFPADIDAVLRYAKSVKTTSEALELPEGDNYFPEIFAEYVRTNGEIKERETRCKQIKAEVLHKMGRATKLTQNGKVLATAKLCQKKAEERPRPGYSYRDFRVPAGAVNP